MFAASVDKKQLGRTAIKLAAFAVLAVIAVLVINKYGKPEADSLLAGETSEQREVYLLTRGIQVDPSSSVAEVRVPEEFDERFESYNATLKADGFDLEPLKGEAVKKCTYTVTNKPELGEDISAVLLIKDDTIVAGHLLNNATGEILALSGAPSEQESVETILPLEPSEQEAGEGEEAQDGEADESEETAADAYPTE